MVTFLLKIRILTINGEDLRKIPTGHELNQVNVKMHFTEAKMKNSIWWEWDAIAELKKGHKVTSMVVMASQMMHHTHDYEWNLRETKMRNKETKNINGMEKWKEDGMKKLMMVGEKCHATWRVMCSKMIVLAATWELPKSLKIRHQT